MRVCVCVYRIKPVIELAAPFHSFSFLVLGNNHHRAVFLKSMRSEACSVIRVRTSKGQGYYSRSCSGLLR